MSAKKKKKQKPVYIDDGRSIADMSGVHSRSDRLRHGTSSSFRDIWATYWSAVRMMVKPMLVVIAFLCVIYLLAAIAFKLM